MLRRNENWGLSRTFFRLSRTKKITKKNGTEVYREVFCRLGFSVFLELQRLAGYDGR
jgi:hypothetical protein